MNKESAADYAVELLAAASEGKWNDLLATGLDAETIELVRVLASMDKDIARLEEREKQLSDALTTRLMPLEFDDGDEPEPAGANASGANGSASVQGSKPAAAGYSEPTGVNASDTKGSALQAGPKPTTTKADPMADLFIQRSTAS